MPPRTSRSTSRPTARCVRASLLVLGVGRSLTDHDGLPGTCPAGPAWGDIPTSATTAHDKTECSSAGVCDRSSGQCKCYTGYEGSACQRSTCVSVLVVRFLSNTDLMVRVQ